MNNILPSKIKIGGHWFEIIEKNHIPNDGKLGTAALGVNKLWINPDQDKTQMQSSLLHEVLEVINFSNDLGLTHNQICVIESFLFQILKDNKDFLKLLMNV